MQEKDFIECSFANGNTKYIGDITHVDAGSFDCRFLNSGDSYTFDSDTMKVTSPGGAISIGTQITTYTLFTADTTQNFQTGGYVVVTFSDNSQLLGQLTDIGASGNKGVTFLDSGSKYVFGSDNSIISTDDKKGLKKFFIYSCGTDYMRPDNFDADVKGILSHNSVSNLITVNGKVVIDEDTHTDGSFQALYSWLRIMQSNEMNDAYTNAKNLVTNNVVTATTSQSYEGYNKPKGSAVYVPYSALSARKVFLIDIETML